MRVWTGRALLVIGAVGLAAGLANVVRPESVFPSSMTCVHDWDILLCNVDPWAAAPWVALLGALAVALGLIVLRIRTTAGDDKGDATR